MFSIKELIRTSMQWKMCIHTDGQSVHICIYNYYERIYPSCFHLTHLSSVLLLQERKLAKRKPLRFHIPLLSLPKPREADVNH